MLDEEYELYEIYGGTGVNSKLNGCKCVITNKEKNDEGKVKIHILDEEYCR